MYCKDLLPNIQIDINERVAIMRKGGVIQLSDFCPQVRSPPTLSLTPTRTLTLTSEGGVIRLSDFCPTGGAGIACDGPGVGRDQRHQH
jgi:hypothetical protein